MRKNIRNQELTPAKVLEKIYVELGGHARRRDIRLKNPVSLKVAGIEVPFDSALAIKPNGQPFAIMHGIPIPNGCMPSITCTGAIVAIPINSLLEGANSEEVVFEIRDAIMNIERRPERAILLAEKTGIIYTTKDHKFGQKMSKSLRSLSRDEIVAGSREPFHREHELLTPLIPFATLYKDTFATKLANIFLDNLVHPDEAALP